MIYVQRILLLLVSVPISLYLWYHVLDRVGATELMWFLFWVNVPVSVLVRVLSDLLENRKEGDK
tara:strand:+ start:406 stop:597 length:192 start_codon:yes stop_codon:yes gene_type:complete